MTGQAREDCVRIQVTCARKEICARKDTVQQKRGRAAQLRQPWCWANYKMTALLLGSAARAKAQGSAGAICCSTGARARARRCRGCYCTDCARGTRGPTQLSWGSAMRAPYCYAHNALLARTVLLARTRHGDCAEARARSGLRRTQQDSAALHKLLKLKACPSGEGVSWWNA